MAGIKSPVKIRDAQQILGAMGYYHGPIDGVLSDRLSEAVRAYQEKNMGTGIWRKTHKLGVLDSGTHADLVSAYSHLDRVYEAPTFYPPTDDEMADARDGLLRAERLLEDG